jgi:hypothetical protein
MPVFKILPEFGRFPGEIYPVQMPEDIIEKVFPEYGKLGDGRYIGRAVNTILSTIEWAWDDIHSAWKKKPSAKAGEKVPEITKPGEEKKKEGGPSVYRGDWSTVFPAYHVNYAGHDSFGNNPDFKSYALKLAIRDAKKRDGIRAYPMSFADLNELCLYDKLIDGWEDGCGNVYFATDAPGVDPLKVFLHEKIIAKERIKDPSKSHWDLHDYVSGMVAREAGTYRSRAAKELRTQ